MTENEKNAVAERISATARMMMDEQDQGYWTLEDYDHEITLAWFDTGNGFACDLTVEGPSGVSNHNGTVNADEKEISDFLLACFG